MRGAANALCSSRLFVSRFRALLIGRIIHILAACPCLLALSLSLWINNNYLFSDHIGGVLFVCNDQLPWIRQTIKSYAKQKSIHLHFDYTLLLLLCVLQFLTSFWSCKQLSAILRWNIRLLTHFEIGMRTCKVNQVIFYIFTFSI